MNQAELYLMMTVTSRKRMPDFIRLYQDKGLETHWLSLGHGTAGRHYLRYLALDETEKMVCLTVVTGRKWLEAKKAMSVRLRIEAPGVGIAYVVPLSAIGGKRELMFLTDGQGYRKGEETTLKGTEQELLIVISNQGYSETVMDAARSAGARGGTVIHARGTGQAKAERFLGISLASEKDIIMIVTATENKTEMMQRIIREAGPETRAQAVVFALPVTDTAGMILRPQSEDLEEDGGLSDRPPTPLRAPRGTDTAGKTDTAEKNEATGGLSDPATEEK